MQMSNKISTMSFAISDTLKEILKTAVLMSKENGQRFVYVFDLFSAMLKVVAEYNDYFNEEIEGIKSLFDEFCNNTNHCCKVASSLAKQPAEIDEYEQLCYWHELFLYCENTYKGNDFCVMTADFLLSAILELQKDNRISNTLNSRYTLLEEEIYDKQDVQERIEYLEKKLEMLDDLISAFGDAEDDEWFDEQELYIDIDEDSLYENGPVKERTSLCRIYMYNPVAYDKIDKFINSIINHQKKPSRILMVGGSKTDVAAVFKEFENIYPYYCELDMKNVSDDRYVDALFGSTETSFPLPGLFTTYIQKYPRCVVAFKNFEYASKKLQERILEILNSGKISDGFLKEDVLFELPVFCFFVDSGQLCYCEADNVINGDLSKDEIFDIAIGKSDNNKFLEKFRACFDEGNVTIFNTLSFFDCMKNMLISFNNVLKDNKIRYRSLNIDYNALAAICFALGYDDFEEYEKKLQKALCSCNDIAQNEKRVRMVTLGMDLPESDTKVSSLFDTKEKKTILLFCSKEALKIACDDFKGEYNSNLFLANEVVRFSGFDEAVAWLNHNSPDMIIVDLSYRYTLSKHLHKNLDEINTAPFRLLRYIKENNIEIPTYLLSCCLYYEDEDRCELLLYKDLLFNLGKCGPVEVLSSNNNEMAKIPELSKSAQLLKNEGLVLSHTIKVELNKDNVLNIILTDLKLRKL